MAKKKVEEECAKGVSRKGLKFEAKTVEKSTLPDGSIMYRHMVIEGGDIVYVKTNLPLVEYVRGL